MTVKQIEQSFRDTVDSAVQVEREDPGRYRVFAPYLYRDGDHPSIVLYRAGGGWVLSDDGSVDLRLSCVKDPEERQKFIASTLTRYSIIDDDGELLATVTDDRYGEALEDLVTAMLRIDSMVESESGQDV